MKYQSTNIEVIINPNHGYIKNGQTCEIICSRDQPTSKDIGVYDILMVACVFCIVISVILLLKASFGKIMLLLKTKICKQSKI